MRKRTVAITLNMTCARAKHVINNRDFAFADAFTNELIK